MSSYSWGTPAFRFLLFDFLQSARYCHFICQFNRLAIVTSPVNSKASVFLSLLICSTFPFNLLDFFIFMQLLSRLLPASPGASKQASAFAFSD